MFEVRTSQPCCDFDPFSNLVHKEIAGVPQFLCTGLLYWAHNCIEGSHYYGIKKTKQRRDIGSIR